VSAPHGGHGLIGVLLDSNWYLASAQLWLRDHSVWIAAAVIVVVLAAVVAPNLVKHRGKRRANLADRVAPLLGYSDKHPAPPGMVKIPRHPAQPGSVVEISYPRHFGSSAAKVGQIGDLVQLLLGGEWSGADPRNKSHRHLSHKLRYVRQAPPAVLPDHAEYVDTTHAVDKVPFAVDADGPVVADLTGLTPMVLGAASTGWGKSGGMARTFLAHMLSHGALADICDPKQISLTEFEGCPNVRYWIEAQDFAAVIGSFLAEIERRYRAKRAGADLTNHVLWPPRLLLLEEMGTLRAMLDEHWTRTKPAGAKPTPEAVGWLLRILWTGRAAGCHVLALAQQANASVMSSSDARDSYALRILAGPTSGNSWRMLFGDEPQVPSSPIKGRAIVGIGPDLREVQLAWIEPERARELALSAPPRAFPESAWGRADVPPNPRAREGVATDVPLDETAGQDVAPIVPLRPSVPPDVPPDVPLEPVKLTCRCGHVWTTTSAKKSRCADCGTEKRVPVNARSAS
jgi:hypothetical protein